MKVMSEGDMSEGEISGCEVISEMAVAQGNM